MVKIRVAAAAFAVSAVCWAVVSASAPTFWTVGTQADFLEGDVENLSIDSDGRVLLGPTASVLAETAAPFLWTLHAGSDGTLWTGSGNEGKLLRIGKDGKVSTFFDAGELEVHALAAAPNGELLAGTESPGRIYRIDPAGKAFVLLDSPFREIHAIRLGGDGTIYAAAVNGSGASAPAASEPAASEPPRPPVPTVSAEITGVTAIESPVTSPTPTSSTSRTPRRSGRGAIYRIRPDGLWDLFWDSGEDSPFDLVVEPSGTLLVGTGTEGKIFRVGGDPARATLLARAGARQVTALARDASGRIIGATSNPGKVFSLSSSPADRGTYESDIRDAGTVASWGAIRWRAALNGGRIELSTRTGNTSTPDETWSDWSKAYSNATGEQIVSPNARYLQWRLTMSGAGGRSPVLTSVTAAYLPRNLRPVVSSITVHPPGTVFQRPFSTGDPEVAGFHDNSPDGRQPNAAADGRQQPAPALGRRFYQKGLQTFVWKAEDGNDDRLHYDVSYRREGDTTWRVLHKGTWDPIFVWDTSSVPDGTYIVKISASDAPSNAPGNALMGELESASFDVDNTPPVVEIKPAASGSTARGRIVFTVTDQQSAIQRVEYSLDASRWRLVHPKDGIPDSRVEEFEIVLDDSEMNGSVILRVTDAMHNVATAVAERK